MKDLEIEDEMIYNNLAPKEKIVVDKDYIKSKISTKLLDQFKNQERVSNLGKSISPEKQ